MLEFWIDPESPYHKDVFASGKEFVFYCNGAWRSALATDVAKQMGLEPVIEMDGGFTAWKNAGYPVADRGEEDPPDGAPPKLRLRAQAARGPRVSRLEAKKARKTERDETGQSGPEMGDAQETTAPPAGQWEWFSPSRGRVVITAEGQRPQEAPTTGPC